MGSLSMSTEVANFQFEGFIVSVLSVNSNEKLSEFQAKPSTVSFSFVEFIVTTRFEPYSFEMLTSSLETSLN
jgi:hypothetical protein